MSGQNHAAVFVQADPSWTVGIVASLWHREIIDKMIEGAKQTLMDAGMDTSNIRVYDAPGSFEIPLIGAKAIETHDALIGFGIVLQGETMHAEAIMNTVSQAMMQLQVTHKKPFAFEVLHVHSLDQARARAEGEHNKGVEAAQAVLHSLHTLQSI